MSFTPEQVREWVHESVGNLVTVEDSIISFLRDHNALDEPTLLTEIVVAEFPDNARLKQLMQQQQDALDWALRGLLKLHRSSLPFPPGYAAEICEHIRRCAECGLWAKPEGWK